MRYERHNNNDNNNNKNNNDNNDNTNDNNYNNNNKSNSEVKSFVVFFNWVLYILIFVIVLHGVLWTGKSIKSKWNLRKYAWYNNQNS